jgi:hypothetical protein
MSSNLPQRARDQTPVARPNPLILNAKAVLLHNSGFFNTCTMKRCLHIKVDFKTNALKVVGNEK